MAETRFGLEKNQSARIIVEITKETDSKLGAGNKEWVKVLECVNGDGTALSPMIILNAQNTDSAWSAKDLPSNWKFPTCKNGLNSNSQKFEWLSKVFEPESRKISGTRPRLLIVNEHTSYSNLKVDAFCSENNIDRFIIPAHYSHLLQPLNVFGPLKEYYAQDVDSYSRRGVKRIDCTHWVEIYENIREKAFTPQNI
jgi:hypothetical protein